MVNVIPLAWLELELGRESWFCWLMPAARSIVPLLLYTSRKYVAFTVLLLLLLLLLLLEVAAAAAAASGGKKHQLKQHLPACFTLLLQT